MKKIECFIPDEINEAIDKLREQKHQTRAEFNRRALENYVYNQLDNNSLNKLKEFLND